MHLQEIYLFVDRRRIGWLRFLLEGYEGLASLSTVSRETGLVRLCFPGQRDKELWGLLSDISQIISCGSCKT
ncbi:MAG: hypothetical protein BWK76_01420 [Desulfobulbaceae bacterium A2]|nr:MAG: hypothetical protein BWK76_01420 [Desulfobulbaceae bacterium A2]